MPDRTRTFARRTRLRGGEELTTILAGMINTDMHPLNPSEDFRRLLMTAHDIAEAVLWGRRASVSG